MSTDNNLTEAIVNSLIAINGITRSVKSTVQELKKTKIEDIGMEGKYNSFSFYGNKQNNVDLARVVIDNASKIVEFCNKLTNLCNELIADNSKIDDNKLKSVVEYWTTLTGYMPFIEKVLENVLKEDQVLSQKIKDLRDDIRNIEITKKELEPKLKKSFEDSINDTLINLNKSTWLKNQLRKFKRIKIADLNDDYSITYIYFLIYKNLKDILEKIDPHTKLKLDDLEKELDRMVDNIYDNSATHLTDRDTAEIIIIKTINDIIQSNYIIP